MSLDFPFFIISDSHFLDKKIIQYSGRPSDQDERMIRNWRSVVRDYDTVIHLGDLFIGEQGEFIEISKQLPGKKYLVLGNHDKESPIWYRDSAGFEVVNRFSLSKFYRGWRITFSHVPIVLTYKNEINVHGHTHSAYFDGLTCRHLNTSAEVLDFTPKDLKTMLDYKINNQLGGDYSN